MKNKLIVKYLILFMFSISLTSYADENAWIESIKQSSPGGVRITNIKIIDTGALVTGYANSNASVSKFMHGISENGVGTCQLSSIQKTAEGQLFYMKIHKPKK